LSLQQTTDPGLNPIIDLLDHIERVDGTYATGVLLHTGHGGSDHSIMMESFRHSNDATAKAAAQARLTQYENAGWDVSGNDREIEICQQKKGWWAIYMFDRAITKRGNGLATDKPLVYIATCYGSLMAPAYVGKGARVGLGNTGSIKRSKNRQQVETFFKRMNGREGQAKRPVSAARAGLTELAAVGAENTTLAPSVLKLTAPCPIKRGDTVTITLDTTCEVGIIPDIVCSTCTIENEVWVNSTTLRGTCTAPPPPGSFGFTIRLKWDLTYSDNNTARLDGNTDPAGKNAHGPAHDDYKKDFSCPDQVHTVGPNPGEILVGEEGSITATVQVGFVSLPGQEVVFTKQVGSFTFTSGDISPDGRQSTVLTDIDGEAEVSFVGDEAGEALVEVTVTGTEISAFSFFKIQRWGGPGGGPGGEGGDGGQSGENPDNSGGQSNEEDSSPAPTTPPLSFCGTGMGMMIFLSVTGLLIQGLIRRRWG